MFDLPSWEVVVLWYFAIAIGITIVVVAATSKSLLAVLVSWCAGTVTWWSLHFNPLLSSRP